MKVRALHEVKTLLFTALLWSELCLSDADDVKKGPSEVFNEFIGAHAETIIRSSKVFANWRGGAEAKARQQLAGEVTSVRLVC